MEVKLVGYTQPAEEFKGDFSSVKDLIAYCARVSNPSNQFNTETTDKLINYLLKHKHFSPFEMASATIEITTTRDIARQILRHRSFTFQEFCISGDSKITTLTKSGRSKKIQIKDLYERYSNKVNWNKSDNLVRVFDETSKTFVSVKIKEVFKTGVKPVYELTLENGKKVISTKEHKFLSRRGFLPLEDLCIDDFVGCNGVPVYQSKEWLEQTKKNSIDEGTGLNGIANQAGVSSHTIRKWLKIHGLQFTKKEVSQYTPIWNKGLDKELQPMFGKLHPNSTKLKMVDSSKKGSESNLFCHGDQRPFYHEVRDFWYKVKNLMYKECQGICAETGKFCTYEDMQIDHKLPISKFPDLAYSRENVRLVHKDFHREKTIQELSTRLETVTWSKVKSIEFKGFEETYDMEVEHSSHNYIANGVVTHNSQRYADPTKDLGFVIREARLQDHKNRQNSIDLNLEDSTGRSLSEEWRNRQLEILDLVKEHYLWAIENGIAKEQARAILPEGNTKSRMYMQGTIRSFIHYIELRREEGTQREHQEVAIAVGKAISQIFPV